MPANLLGRVCTMNVFLRHLIAVCISFILCAGFLPTAGADANTPATSFGWSELGYHTWKELFAFPAPLRPRVDPTCPGGYLLTINTLPPIRGQDIWAYADQVHASHNGISILQGHVEVRQTDRMVCADSATIDQQTNHAAMHGHMLISEPGYSAVGDKGDTVLHAGISHLEHARYVLSRMRAHGHAEQISRDPQGRTTIHKGSISTCPPNDPDWALHADTIVLNPLTGRGEALNSVLRVKNTPILYLPYFNFPIDGRRQTGVLMPTFGSSSINGISYAQPIYLNLAPNYDATITPSILSKRGLWLQGEFRYLDDSWGKGILEGGYLQHDREGFPVDYNPVDAVPNSNSIPGENRKSLSWQHTGSLADGWTAHTDINYVSDKYYFQDLGSTAALSTATWQNRMGEVDYRDKNNSFKTDMQAYQILDPTITDANKPYSRFPEIAYSRLWTSQNQLIQSGINLDYVNFRRQISDGSGLSGSTVIAGDPYIQGTRLRADPFVDLRAEKSWGYVQPTFTLKHLNDQLSNATPAGSSLTPADQIPLYSSVTVPTLSVDSGLKLDRELASGGVETLEPRLFYLYAPYRNQDQIPVFDTMENPLTYAQLFRTSRFVGMDRLDDADQIALGVNNRWLDADGNENYRLGIGDMRYLRPLKIYATIPPPNTLSTGLVSDASARLNSDLSLTGNMTLDPSWRYTQLGSINLHWQPPGGMRVVNLGINYVHAYTGYNVLQGIAAQSGFQSIPTFRLASGSFVTPLNEHWQLLGLWQYDMALYHTQEAIGGIQYESCCWRARLVDSIYLSDFLAVNNTPTYNRSIMFQFEFKGLGGYSRQVENMLSQAILGYQQIANSEHP